MASAFNFFFFNFFFHTSEQKNMDGCVCIYEACFMVGNTRIHLFLFIHANSNQLIIKRNRVAAKIREHKTLKNKLILIFDNSSN